MAGYPHGEECIEAIKNTGAQKERQFLRGYAAPEQFFKVVKNVLVAMLELRNQIIEIHAGGSACGE